MKHFILFLGLATLLGSCNLIGSTRIRGNGTITAKTFNLSNFDKIDIGGAKSLFVTQDSVFSVKVETDANLFEHLGVSVRDGELRVSAMRDFRLLPTAGIKIFVSLPILKKLDISGASDVKTIGRLTQSEKLQVELSGASTGILELRTPDIRVDASGASTLTISGEARDLTAEISGASTFEGLDLKAENTTIEASGASKGSVFASVRLKADASGASNINYRGNAQVSEKSSGASSVKKVQ